MFANLKEIHKFYIENFWKFNFPVFNEFENHQQKGKLGERLKK